jgi:hypothetical protein
LTFAKFVNGALESVKIIEANDTESYRLSLSDADVMRGRALLEEISSSSSEEGKIRSLHAFAYPLLSTDSEERAGETKWEDPLQSFLAILFLRPDGNFAPARGVTQSLSHFKYAIRNCNFYEAYNNRHQFGGNLTK